MLTIIFDVLRWCFSKALVVVVIAIAAVATTMAFHYGVKQEKLLAEKVSQEAKLKQLRDSLLQALESSRETADKLKAVNNRLAKPQEELDNLKKQLAKNNPQLKKVLEQLGPQMTEVQRTAADSLAKVHAKAAAINSDLGAQTLLQKLGANKPDMFRHPIDYVEWRLALRAGKSAANETSRVLTEVNDQISRAVAAANSAKEKYAQNKKLADTLSQVSAQYKNQLQALEAEITAMLPDKDKAARALESAEQQVQDLRASENTAVEGLADLTGRIQWYENLRSEFIGAFYSSQTTIILLVVMVFGGPPAMKVFWFYIVAGFAKSASPLRYEISASGSAIAVAEGTTLEAPVKQDFACRPEWVKSWPPETKRRTKALWDWQAPAISYVAGLRELSCFSVENATAALTVTLGAGNNPNMHLLRLDLEDHPGFVLRPDRVVAISGNLGIRTKWNFVNLNSWVSGSFRKILFYGTGTLYIRGYGGVNAIDCGNSPRNMEEDFVIGYDSRSVFRTVRTETFWPYFRNKTSLFDYAFSGPGLTLSETAKPSGAKNTDNPLKRTLDAILNPIGKLLGF